MPVFRRKDEDFFKTWSPSMAYVLGFFAADGSMSINKRGGHFIDFTSTDRLLVENVKSALSSDLKIGRYQPKNRNSNARFHLQIGSKQIFRDLIKLGFTPRKSLSMRLPSVPRRYFNDFIRGYFEGDGNVYINKKHKGISSGFTSGSRQFLEDMFATLKNLHVVSGGTLFYHENGFRLYFSTRDSRRLYDFMYGRNYTDLYLPRKKLIFEKYFGIS